MYNENDKDLSNVQVPQSLIQEILSQTEPLKEAGEEIYPAPKQAPAPEQISEQGEMTKLLSLMFEEFDKLNSRLDKLQISINEMGTHSGAITPFLGEPEKPKPKKKQQSIADLLAKRIAR